MNDKFDFGGKTVFAAGGSSGIKLAIAETFAARWPARFKIVLSNDVR